MLTVHPRRLTSRPTNLLVVIFFTAILYWLVRNSGASRYHSAGWHNGAAESPTQIQQAGPVKDSDAQQVPLNGESTEKTDLKPELKPIPDNDSGSQSKSDSKTTESISKEEAKKKADEKKEQEEHDKFEKALRKQFEREHLAVGRLPGAGAIYGNTLNALNKTDSRTKAHETALKATEESASFSADKPFIHDPYPSYNSKEWIASNRASFVACEGPDGRPVDDIKVFKGTPRDFPKPSFGSYEVLDLDGNLCFERETRLGVYGFTDGKKTKMDRDWDSVSWGQLQEKCVNKNSARYDMKGKPNPFLNVYGHLQEAEGEPTKFGDNKDLRRVKPEGGKLYRRSEQRSPIEKEKRTAILIRTYTGHEYTENDKQIIRSLVSELSLRTGGQYQVFLFVHVKDSSIMIWEDEETYEYVVHVSVPPEFTDMAILWNDEAVQSLYPKLGKEQATVHVAQWLSVQKFSQEFPEFDYVWNWELDSRVTGHHYDFLEKLSTFAKKQPRRGLWERNERYYIPSIHGDFDTDFRREVDSHAVNGSVWGPPDLPFITSQGPKPPTKSPKDDDFKWGVGEEADVITVAPIFNPINSSWIGWFDTWGYNDSSHYSLDVPRRATIITQSRVSKRLLDLMHVENLRGNHVSSEMTTQTVALLHGLKAVYAPMPVYFDRPWDGKSLAKWFNGGHNGESGGYNSAYGWGREGRFAGSTWYYRATPPQRLYLNFMGWEDTWIGGQEWEEAHGRPCLPPMMLHPLKDIQPTFPGYYTESNLPYS